MGRSQLIAWRGSAIVVWLSSCVITIEPDPKHCMHNDGNAFCVEQHTKKIRPFCAYASCDAAYGDGCVGTQPVDEACYSPCGGGKSLAEDPGCDVPIVKLGPVRDPVELPAMRDTGETGAGESETASSETTAGATGTESSEATAGGSETDSSGTTS